MMSLPRMPCGAAAALLAALLMSCQSAPTHVFTLDPVAPPSTPASYAGPAVRVDSVHFPPALDRVEIVSFAAPGELKINDLDHWSAPLGQAARQTLTADLVTRLPDGRVIFPHLAKPDDALGVNVDVLEFKAGPGGASLEASWLIESSESKSGSFRGTALLRTDMSGTDTAATPRALSALLGQLADLIAADLRRRCCGAPAAASLPVGGGA